MSDHPTWVNDNCLDSNYPDDIDHASGLLGLHAPCTPPCPRKSAALSYLDRHGIRGNKLAALTAERSSK